MRIDASNLLLAGQVQATRAQNAVKPPAFEPLDFSKPVQSSERKSAAAPVAARLGSRLDIKV
jgi:hypothetical protein